MDKITVKNLRFTGRHGCFAHEMENPRLFAVSLEMGLSLREAGLTDSLERTIDYPAAMGIVEGVIMGESVRLIETLAEKISERLFVRFANLREIRVKVEKCKVDVGFDFDEISVEIFRTRSDFIK